jgi:hypothetical protein
MYGEFTRPACGGDCSAPCRQERANAMIPDAGKIGSFFLRAAVALTLAALAPGRAAGAEGAGGDRFPFLVASTQALDAADCRQKALACEASTDLPAALTAWERVLDRCPATEEQRIAARSRIAALRPQVPRNTDPARANDWKALVLVFRHLDFTWTGQGNKAVHVRKTVNESDEKKIRGSVAAYQKLVFELSSGMLRVDADIRIVDVPVTNLAGKGQGPFSPAPHLLYPLFKPLLEGRRYDTVFAYVKFNGDEGPEVPAPFTAATYASIREVNGGGFVTVPWHTNYPYPGETDGEMELHEWLHQIDWMFSSVLRYPNELVPTSDAGRMEGDTRPGVDLEYARKPSETTWIGFYRHIMEDHVTRQMWHEARMRAE